MILGVPITDTVFAIFRRLLNKEPISHADKRHLHHRLMQIGLTHRQTVLVIYGIALIFFHSFHCYTQFHHCGGRSC